MSKRGAYDTSQTSQSHDDKHPQNQPAFIGKEAILQGLGYFWSQLEKDEHTLLTILGNDQVFALEALNAFTRKDGKQTTIPAVAITERNEAGLVKSVRLFMDVAPLFA